MMVTENPADYTEEYLYIREDTTLKCVRLFTKVLVTVSCVDHLRAKLCVVVGDVGGWGGGGGDLV
jgi:hypothetical protein